MNLDSFVNSQNATIQPVNVTDTNTTRTILLNSDTHDSSYNLLDGQTHFVIYDSGGPDGYYQNSEDFTITLNVKEGKALQLLGGNDFVLNLESSTTSFLDVLYINNNQIKDYVNTNKYYTTAVVIKFVSDTLVARAGFKLTFKEIDLGDVPTITCTYTTTSNATPTSINILSSSATFTSIFGGSSISKADISSIVLEGFTSIGEDAFRECSSLASVNIPNTVTSIGESAFYQCSSLASLTIGDSVNTIDGYAFYQCSSLASVTIPNSVTSIGEYAFYQCSSLASINIPNLVTSIGNDAFYECSSLASVTIGDSVTSIGSYAFERCSSLAFVNIPDSVTSIGTAAFRQCSSLASVTIPDSVTSIGTSAFDNCSSLASLTIGASVTIINSFTFCKCTSLASVTIPVSVTSIGYRAFYQCSSLVIVIINNHISTNKPVINYAAFNECPKLKTIILNDNFNLSSYYNDNDWGVKDKFTIYKKEDKKFYKGNANNDRTFTTSTQFTYLDEILFGYNDSNYSIAKELAHAGYDLVNYNLNDKVIFYKTLDDPTTIKNKVISPDDNGVYSVQLSDVISDNNKDQLSSILFSNIEKIQYEGFQDCTNLTSVTMDNSMNFIGYKAFYNDISLSSIVLPNSLKELKWATFQECKKLSTVQFGVSLESIEGDVFNDCTSLTSLTFPNTLQEIKYRAFTKCSNLTSIVIPTSVTKLGKTNTNGTSYTNRENGVFVDCSNLYSIVISSNTTDLGLNNFKNIAANPYLFYYDETSNTYYQGTLDNNNIVKKTPEKLMYSNMLPSTITSNELINAGYTVDDFSTDSNIRTVPFTSSLNSNTENAYLYLTNGIFNASFSNILFPVNVTKNNLTSINLSGISKISYQGFKDCTALTSVIIDNSLTEIAGEAFHNDISLSSIVLPDTVQEIKYSTFQNCFDLNSVQFGDSLQRIEGDAFNKCHSLTSLTFPNTLQEIKYSAFNKCSSLSSILIPTSVQKLGLTNTNGTSYTNRNNGVFVDCSNLNVVVISSKTSVLGLNNFKNIAANPYLFYYDESSKVYYEGILNNNNNIVKTDPEKTISSFFTLISNITSNKIINAGYTITKIYPNKCTYTTTSSSTPQSITIDSNSATFTSIFGSSPTITKADLSSIVLEGFTSIGEDAFEQCSSLASVTIGNSVTSISNNAFSGCSRLASVNILDSVTTISEKAFYQCTNLSSVMIPNSVTSIGDDAFFQCSSLASVTIGDSVTSIGDGAFYKCSSLASVAIPNSVTRIGIYAFQSCTALQYVTIPNSVTSISETAFQQCSRLNTIISSYININLPQNTFKDTPSTKKFYLYHNQTNSFYDGSYVLTNNVYQLQVTKSPVKIYSKEEMLQVATFKDFKTAGYEKFFTNLEGKYTLLNHAGKYTCYGDAIIPFTFESAIPYYINKEDIVSLEVPEGVKVIGENAFMNCSQLKTVTLPSSLTDISDNAFYGCIALKNITIPTNVVNIAKNAFFGCILLETTNFSIATKSIADEAFYGNITMESLTIPTSVNSLGTKAFEKCLDLKNVLVSDAMIANQGNNTFKDISSNPNIYIYRES